MIYVLLLWFFFCIMTTVEFLFYDLKRGLPAKNAGMKIIIIIIKEKHTMIIMHTQLRLCMLGLT